MIRELTAMPGLMIFGVCMFFTGVLSVLLLLSANGGWDKSRQFAVLGQLLSGKLGALRRTLSRTALLLTFMGAVLCFAGVGQMDARRAQRCHDHCIAAAYLKGTIGPSVDRTSSRRFVACACTAPGKPPLELRADSIRAK